MDNSDSYKPKFDPETGLPLTDSASEEVAAVAQPAQPEAPFDPVNNSAYDSGTHSNWGDAPFTAAAPSSPDQAQSAQVAYQAQSAQAAYQAHAQVPPYQPNAQTPPYQAGVHTPYQAGSYQNQGAQAPYQANPYQNASGQAPRGSGIQYSNQPGIPYGTGPMGSMGPTNTLAVVSLVTGIVSILFMFLAGSIALGIIGLLCGIAGIITGTMALKQIKTSPASSSSKGMAIAGISCGAVGLVLSLIITIACAACYASLGGVTKQAFENLDKFAY